MGAGYFFALVCPSNEGLLGLCDCWRLGVPIQRLVALSGWDQRCGECFSMTTGILWGNAVRLLSTMITAEKLAGTEQTNLPHAREFIGRK